MEAIVAGTFDPFTAGHCDIVTRAAALFDRVTVAVALETGKNCAPSEDRVRIVEASIGGLGNVEVVPFGGLLCDFVKSRRGKKVLVRGIRGVRDFEYERDLSRVYAHSCGVESVFLCSSPNVEYISSTLVRELARLDAPLDGYVADGAVEYVKRLYGSGKGE